MKTKKFILVLILFFGSITTYSQLNPVLNLQIDGFYGFPEYTLCPAFNCFYISWDVPEPSVDTLKGYNLHKNNTFWRFTLQNNVDCMGNFPCAYSNIYDSMPCTIKVKAVYNHDSLESVANDSVYIDDIAIGIKNPLRDNFIILKNPINLGEQISIRIPDNSLKNCNIKIVSIEGRLAKEIDLMNFPEQIINISSDKLNRGIYIVHLQMEEKIISMKVIVE